MSTLGNIQTTLGKAWDSLSEGWQHLYQRCQGALTRFDKAEGKSTKVDERRINWGLLNTDLTDDGASLTVLMEVPGLDKSDINIEITGNLLTVSGVKHFEKECDEGEYHIMECAYGRFQRSLTLPELVSEEQVEAVYKNGVLRISLPKVGDTKKVEIEVK